MTTKASNLHRYPVFLVTWICFFCSIFMRNCMSPIVDVLQCDLGTTAAGVATMASFTHLMYCSMQIPMGVLMQICPVKYVLPISICLLGTCSLLFSFATNVRYATITSSLAGLLSGPVWLCDVRIIEQLFSLKQVPFALGLQISMSYGGIFLMNFVQAQIYEQLHEWRVVFVGQAIICWIAGIALFFLLRADEQPTPAIVANTSNTSESELSDFFYKKFSELWTASRHALALKWNWVLSLWGFCGLCLVNGFINLWFIPYLMLKFGYSRSAASLISGSFNMTMACSSLLCGRLAMAWSKRKIFLILASVLWLCFLLIVYVLPATGSLPVMMAVIALVPVGGLGGGAIGTMWTLQREYNAYYHCKDMAAGLVNTMINVSGFFTQMFVGEMLDIRWERRGGEVDPLHDGLRVYTVNDYNHALLLLPVVLVIALLLSLTLKETNGKNLDYSRDCEKTKATNGTETTKCCDVEDPKSTREKTEATNGTESICDDVEDPKSSRSTCTPKSCDDVEETNSTERICSDDETPKSSISTEL